MRFTARGRQRAQAKPVLNRKVRQERKGEINSFEIGSTLPCHGWLTSPFVSILKAGKFGHTVPARVGTKQHH
jgi:hypothetical protein